MTWKAMCTTLMIALTWVSAQAQEPRAHGDWTCAEFRRIMETTDHPTHQRLKTAIVGYVYGFLQGYSDALPKADRFDAREAAANSPEAILKECADANELPLKMIMNVVAINAKFDEKLKRSRLKSKR